MGINDAQDGIPLTYRLYQNFPNPFNPSTNIRFDLLKAGFVTLKVFNIMGQEVATLVNENLQSGKYNIQWNISRAAKISSGVYFYQLKTAEFVRTRKLILLQ